MALPMIFLCTWWSTNTSEGTLAPLSPGSERSSTWPLAIFVTVLEHHKQVSTKSHFITLRSRNQTCQGNPFSLLWRIISMRGPAMKNPVLIPSAHKRVAKKPEKIAIGSNRGICCQTSTRSLEPRRRSHRWECWSYWPGWWGGYHQYFWPKWSCQIQTGSNSTSHW